MNQINREDNTMNLVPACYSKCQTIDQIRVMLLEYPLQRHNTADHCIEFRRDGVGGVGTLSEFHTIHPEVTNFIIHSRRGDGILLVQFKDERFVPTETIV